MSQEANNNKEKQPAQEAVNERIPGQGNSSDGLTRRLGADVERRGEKDQQQIQKGEGNGEEERTREGSQGGSKGQQS